MEQEGTQDPARNHEVGEETHELVDLSDLLKQLEAEKHRDPLAAQQLIQLLEQILEQFQPVDDPDLYASIQTHLGAAYHDLPTGDRIANLKEAIACYQQALHYLTSEATSFEYAVVQTTLGNAYHDLGVVYPNLTKGDRTTNLKEPIACYQRALHYLTFEATPSEYATVQAELGNAYNELPMGDRAANLTKAIACFQEALRFRTPEATPHDYALTQKGLGSVYHGLLSGDRGENLKQTIACCQEALRFLTPETDPFEYATIQTNLGSTYSQLPTGDRKVNLSIAIACFQATVRVAEAAAQ